MPGYVRNRGKTKAVVRDGKLIKKPRTKWQARWRHPEESRRTAERHFPTKALAEAWIEQQDRDAWAGTLVDSADARLTFAEVVEGWRETWMNLEPRTRAGYNNILARRILSVFGDRRIGQISHDDVQGLINAMAAERAPNTVHRMYTVLRGVFAHAHRRRYIKVNPCEGVVLPSKRRGKPRMLFLTPGEVRAVAEAVPSDYRVAVYVAAWCGLRAGELWALRHDDVTLDGKLRVDESLRELNGKDVAPEHRGLSFGPPKTEAGRRTMTLPQPIAKMLAEHMARDLPGGNGPRALLFTTPSGHAVRHGLFYRRVFRPAVKASLPADKQKVRWHDLRHTAASLSLAVEPKLYIVKERLGHEDIRTTINQYGHLLPSVDEALADGLALLFEDRASDARRV